MRIPRGSVAFDELARAQDYEAEEDHVGRSGDGDPHADRGAGGINHRQREIEQREENCARLGLKGHGGQGHAEATSRSSDSATPLKRATRHPRQCLESSALKERSPVP